MLEARDRVIIGISSNSQFQLFQREESSSDTTGDLHPQKQLMNQFSTEKPYTEMNKNLKKYFKYFK